ncbi:MAG: restriction endonuclease subunit S [Candidatus Entotheonellia bacterium]
MAGEWMESALGDVIELKRGYDLPQQQRRSGHVPIVSSSGITDYHAEAIVKGPGVVTGRYGTLGQVFYITEDFWPLNTTLYVRDFKGNDPRFISYFLRSLDFLAYSDKAAVPGLNRNHLHTARVRFPTDVAEQRAIAHILGTLDDKIELNQRMNETLEAMARAIFQSWFVDFDPVHAKAEGRDPGLPKEIADLFPDRFEDSELGDIPAGWSIKTIEDVAERVAMGPFGSSIKVETFVPEGVPIISGQHLHGFILEDSTFNFITHEHASRLSNAAVQRGDVVFTHAGNIGQAAFIPKTSRYERYVISQRQFYMRCDLSQVNPTFIALYFNSPEGRHLLLANTSSSGVPSIARPVTYLRSIQIPVPSKSVLDAFERLVRPLLHQYSQNLDVNRTLAALHDTLLPKLISGDLRVKDAERVTGGGV